jgi:hypothetical protein
MLFWVYVLAYSVCRFFIQFYRVDTPFALGLSQAQLLSVLMAMVAVWALVFQLQRARRYGPAHGPATMPPTAVAATSSETTPAVAAAETVADGGEDGVAEHAPISG